MKLFSILLLAILGAAMTVIAVPAPVPEAEAAPAPEAAPVPEPVPEPAPKPVARPKPFPGELAMVEAREVFEGSKASSEGPDDGPDSVEAEDKEDASENPQGTDRLFKRAPTCPWNYWYCKRVKGCCKRSPEYRCCDFGCCKPGYYCCGWDGRCWRSWMC